MSRTSQFYHIFVVLSPNRHKVKKFCPSRNSQFNLEIRVVSSWSGNQVLRWTATTARVRHSHRVGIKQTLSFLGIQVPHRSAKTFTVTSGDTWSGCVHTQIQRERRRGEWSRTVLYSGIELPLSLRLSLSLQGLYRKCHEAEALDTKGEKVSRGCFFFKINAAPY